MKKTLFFLLLGISIHAAASTSITTASVSGHWTMAGNPYYVYNDIAVLPNTSLTIDAGVEVVFRGLYRMDVQGTLRAAGSAALPISFKAFDTTGWSNDLSPLGGWRGIQFNTYSSSAPDSSAFEYCNVTDMKYGATGSPVYHTGCFFADNNRHLAIKNCNFYHNIAEAGYGRCIILYGSQTMDSCTVHDNRAIMAVVAMSLAHPVINHSAFYHNYAYQMITSELLDPAAYHSASVLNCDIYENTSSTGGTQINVSTGHAVIRGCKVHHNTNQNQGAICCWGGKVEIAENLICNNVQTVAGTCGAVEGGGALHLCYNISTSSADSTGYIVRNNVIANNYSASGMGAGVYVWHANVWIMNNTIINNVGDGPFGVAIGLVNFGSSAHIKNNIICNNKLLHSTTAYPEVQVLNGDTVEFEHNWMQRPFSQNVSGSAYILTGDTATNIIGSDPHLADPSDSASYTESALAGNFALTSLSPCIDRGDTTGCLPYATDYAGNPRIVGSTIDIGAYEYQSVSHANIAAAEAKQVVVYPNPASGRITVYLPAATGMLKITDATGRMVYAAVAIAQTTLIDAHAYPPGLYLMEWVPGNGAAQVTKIIVE